LRANLLLISGRLRFPRDRIDTTILMPNGRDYKVFRQVAVRPGRHQPPVPGAVFTP